MKISEIVFRALNILTKHRHSLNPEPYQLMTISELAFMKSCEFSDLIYKYNYI